MNPNPEIWGDSSAWHDAWFIGGLSGAQYESIAANHIKVANFGGTLDNASGTLRRGVTQNKITANQPIDATICPCGQDKLVSPFAKIAIYPKNDSPAMDIDPTPMKVETEIGNINWFFCEMNNGDDTYGQYHYTGDEESYDQWSPNSVDNSSNKNYNIQPFVFWQTKSLMLTIMVKPITGYDSSGLPIGNTWVTLDEWKTDYNTNPIMGYGLRGNVVSSTSLSDITYSYATADVSRPIYFHCGVIKNIDDCNRYSIFYGRGGYSMVRLLDVVGYVSTDCRIAIPLYQYFTNQKIKRTRGAYWNEIPYSAENYEKCLQIAALFGCYFTPTNKYEFNYNMLDNDLYLPILDDNGVAHGKYTNGADNANNSLYSKRSIRDINYDPYAKHYGTYCKVCGYGGEYKSICPRCHATGEDLVNIPAMTQGPIWKLDVDDPEYGSLYELDMQRDQESGYTNPNLHRRAELQVEGSYEELWYPNSSDVPLRDFEVDTIEDVKTITKYNGTENYVKISDMFVGAGYTTLGKGLFTDTDVVYVEIPEGITTIE